MPILAAVDVGSNAIRLVVATIDADRHINVLENVREPVRLGVDVFTKGLISEQTLERASEAFQSFKRSILQHGAKWTRAVATSAVREALNRDLFVDRIAQSSGIELSVIGPEEEARLIHLAVAEKLDIAKDVAMLVDIGGGSTEVTLVADGNIISTESYRMGAVRLLHLLEGEKHSERHFNQLVREYVDATQKRLRKEIGKRHVGLCVGTGGNIETLGYLRTDVLGKEKNTVITREELEELVKRLSAITYEGRVQELGLRPDRADVIVPASIILQNIVRQAGVEEVQIPHVGLKDGLLLDMLDELYGGERHPHRPQVMTSALELGRKFQFDEQHGTTVARLAVQLFDETRSLHGLGLEHRQLLEVAALLHDIGTFVNVHDHHKHTQYMLGAIPIVGLSPLQQAIVSNVARYHRKSMPKPQHDAFRLLSAKDRVIVSKLAAILRLADALDNEHASKVGTLSVEYKKPKLLLRLQGDGDMLLEKWALAKKAGMFEEVFSVRVVMEE
jgi:exopolyphosphatase / guanosine-5'-triphosphate,3'-diphosphate pyrophosphatase